MPDNDERYRDPEGYLNHRLSYFQRSGQYRQSDPIDPRKLLNAGVFTPGTRYMFTVCGVGREEKKPAQPPVYPQLYRLRFEDLLAGAFTHRMPVALQLKSDLVSGLTVHLGTWHQETGKDKTCILRCNILKAILAGLYPAVYTTKPSPVPMMLRAVPPHGGLVMGVPTIKPPEPQDVVVPIDRVIRALGLHPWSALILAAPEDEEQPRLLREALVDELRDARVSEKAGKIKDVLVEHFMKLADPSMESLIKGAAVGSWRTAVYLWGEADSYPIVASEWQSVFSGKDSKPEPIRAFELPPDFAGQCYRTWDMPKSATPTDRGFYSHPFDYQTLLNSDQLAAYIHFPSVETPGFWIDATPRYDMSVAPPAHQGAHLVLGKVIGRPQGTRRHMEGVSRTKLPEPPFSIPIDLVAGHVFVAGVTNSGKTATTQKLLRSLYAEGVNFVVIEPAKKEYRNLRAPLSREDEDLSPELVESSHALAADVAVITAADERQNPLRINPFEFEGSTSVAEHIDLLRSLFEASFGDMWAPLPQVLERCLYRVYSDRGWDLATGVNRRLDDNGDRSMAFPRLGDLADIVPVIVNTLGFDEEARMRVIGNLVSRIIGLAAGAKGAMFDTQEPFPMEQLLSSPAVIELEAMGDESDKAFLIGLILLRLVEYRRGEQSPTRTTNGEARAAEEQNHASTAERATALRHVLLVEEAHRLLANVTAEAGGQNAARVKAVEAFANLLAEIRAYGEGIIIVDQIPTKLTPDVIKNTGVKIAHRIVDEADRRTLGGAMAMSETQMLGLALLAQGEAVFFGDGDDAPVLIEVDKPPRRGTAITSDKGILRTRHWACDLQSRPHEQDDSRFAERVAGCTLARELAEREQVRDWISRMSLAAIEPTKKQVSSIATHLRSTIRSDLTPRVDEETALRCLAARGAEWLAGRRGAERSWMFHQTRTYAEHLRRVLIATTRASLESNGRDAVTLEEQISQKAALDEYRLLAVELYGRAWDPYPSCESICDHAPLCTYRDAAAHTLRRPSVMARWNALRAEQYAERTGPVELLEEVFKLAEGILGPGGDIGAKRRCGLCVTQQALAIEANADLPWNQVRAMKGYVDLTRGFDVIQAILDARDSAGLEEDEEVILWLESKYLPIAESIAQQVNAREDVRDIVECPDPNSLKRGEGFGFITVPSGFE